MVFKLAVYVRMVISLFYKPKTRWNFDICNFFSEKFNFSYIYCVFWKLAIFDVGRASWRHFDVKHGMFVLFWYVWIEEANTYYTMVPNKHIWGYTLELQRGVVKLLHTNSKFVFFRISKRVTCYWRVSEKGEKSPWFLFLFSNKLGLNIICTKK